MATTTKFRNPVTVVEVRINAHECGECGVVFGLAEDYEQRRRNDGKTWYCPNGHPRAWVESEADRLKKQLKQAEERIASEEGWGKHLSGLLDSERKSHASTKGQLTKTRKRIGNGVCPDCNRHFTNVERHMATKHRQVPQE